MDRSNKQEWAKPDPEYSEFFSTGPNMHDMWEGEVNQVRKATAQWRKSHQKTFDPAGIEIDDREVTSDSGYLCSVRTYRPSENTGATLPAVVVFHGGNFIVGDLSSEQGNAVEMVRRLGVLVLNVDFRRAPENPFPAGLKDAWFALDWLIKEADELKVDVNRIVLYGSSSGANLAAVVAQTANEKDIKVLGQVLRVPMVCHPAAWPEGLVDESSEEFADSPMLTKAGLHTGLRHYAANVDPANPKLSPLLGNQQGLGPVFIQVAGRDILRDQGIAYYEKCKQAGVDATIKMYNGTPHAFLLIPACRAAIEANDDMIAFLKGIL